MTAAPKCQQGLSLIEMLVALTVAALLFTFLFSALGWGERGRRVAQQTEESGRIDAVHDLLHRLVAGAVPKAERGLDGPVQIFAGEDSRIVFVGPAPAQVETPGLYRISLSLERMDEGQALVLRRTLFRQRRAVEAADPFEETTPYVLIADVEAFKISYFGVYGEAEDPEWRDDWTGVAALPFLVRVDLEFGPDDTRQWTPLVVKPYLSR